MIASPVLERVTLEPAIRLISSVTPAPALPPEVRRIIFSVAANQSVAEIEYVVLLSGVVTDPPKATVVPLTVIPELTRALFGILVRVLLLAEIVQLSKVLLVSVCVWVK